MKKHLIFRTLEILFLLVILVALFTSLLEFAPFSKESLLDLLQGSTNQTLPLYMALFIILALLGFSIPSMLVVGGVLFPFWQAVIASFFALNTASLIAFFASSFVQESILSKRHPTYHVHFSFVNKFLHKMKQSIEKAKFFDLILLRVFLANIPLSFAAGMLKNLDKSRFILATVTYNTLICLVMISLGSSLSKNSLYIGIVIGILAALLIIRFFYHQRKEKELDEQ